MYTIFATIFDMLLFTTHKSNEIYSKHRSDTRESADNGTSEKEGEREREAKHFWQMKHIMWKNSRFLRPLHGTNWMHVQA